MISSKAIIFVAIFLFACYVNLGQSLKCVVCQSNNLKDCNVTTKLYECNATFANATTKYLATYHNKVQLNYTDSRFDCIREDLKIGSMDLYYRGCIYHNMVGCNLPLRDQSTKSNKCKQCSKGDACNPAGRIELSGITIALTTLAAFALMKLSLY